MKTDHFEGKSVQEHLKAARAKGALAAAEIHGTEMPDIFQPQPMLLAILLLF